ncbi:MAG: hypothetical protein GY940_14250 [bacterium]|nr:hypothetical protein [bacterium]
MIILLFILLNILMIFAAHLAAWRYSPKSAFSQQLITTFLLYASQITVSVLFLGVVVKNLDMGLILLLNGGGSLFIIVALRGIITESILQTHEKIRRFSKEILGAEDIFLYLFICLFITQIIVLLVKTYYLPSHVWDVFAYHLHPVAEWFQQSMIPGSIDSPVVRVNRNPMGSRLFHFWSLGFSGDTRWVELPQFIFGLMVPLASYSIMSALDVKKNTALRYAILVYFIPLILIESRTCQDHLVLTGATLMAVVYFIAVFYKKDSSQLVFLALALGLLLGIKISSPHIIGVFFLALALGKGWRWREISAFLKENKRRILIGMAIVFTLGGYWFFNNQLILESYTSIFKKTMSLKIVLAGLFLVLSGVLLRKIVQKFSIASFIRNHRKPITGLIIIILVIGGYGLFKQRDLVNKLALDYKSPAPLLKSRAFYEDYPIFKPLRSRFLSNVLSFPYRVKDIGLYTSYTPDFLETSGFGIQFFAFGLLAFLGMFIRLIVKRGCRGEIAGFIFIFPVVLLLSYFFYYYTPANYRLFMFFPVFGIILWTYLTQSLRLPNYSLRFIDGLIVVMLLFNITTCFFEGNMDKNRWKTLFTIDNPLDRTPVKYSTFFKEGAEAWQYIDNYLPDGEPVGYMGHYDSWVFPYFDNRLERKIFYLPALPGFRPVSVNRDTHRLQFNPTFVEHLKRNRIHYIHLNPQGVHYTQAKRFTIEDERVYPVTENLYYFKW